MKKNASPPYTIDEEVLERFDQRRTVFGRMLFDTKADFYSRGIYDDMENIVGREEKGYSRMDFARVMGTWTVNDHFHGAFSWDKLSGANNVLDKPELEKYEVEDTEAMSWTIKETARLYGASQVGITKLDLRWVYSHDRKGKPIVIPEGCDNAIVMGIRMDPAAIRESPNFDACTETALGYSRMAFCIACLAEFIRNLGYRAIPMGNDTALSIPLAIDAGLGELGRNGLLVTPEHGPCQRICKVFTDLPLKTDEPRTFGVSDYCRGCRKCAEACKAEAISLERDPSYETACQSNNSGILRWAVNQDKCYGFWLENGGDCSSCIAACPFVKG